MSDEEPPMQRLRLELTMDAHSLDDLWRQLRTLANDIEYEGVEERRVVSGGGWHFTLTKRSDLTEDEYTEQLLAWHDRKRAS